MRDLVERRWLSWVVGGAVAVVVVAVLAVVAIRLLGGDDVAEPPTGGDGGAGPIAGPSAGDSAAIDEIVPVTDVSADYQWEPLAAGAGGFVTGLVTHPVAGGPTYAYSDVGGAYRWDPAARRWLPIIDASRVPEPRLPGDYIVESMAVSAADVDRVYLAAGGSVSTPEGRVLRSDDRGESWVDGGQRWALHGNAEWRAGGPRLAVDPRRADVVYLGTRVDGLWRSTDGAVTWQRLDDVPAGPAEEHVSGVTWVVVDGASDEIDGRSSVVYAGVGREGVYGSTDRGDTWTQLWSTSAVPHDAEIDTAGRLYVVEREPSRVVRYGPAEGQPVDVSPSSGPEFSTIAVDPTDPNRVILGENGVRSGSLWRSNDRATSWTSLDVSTSCPQIPWLDVYGAEWLSSGSLEFDRSDPGLLWFPEGFAVWQTTDIDQSQVTFTCATDGIENMVANDVVVPPGGVPVTARWDRGLFHQPSVEAAEATQGPTDRFNSAWDLDWTPADPDFVAAVVADHRFCCEGDGQAYLSGWSDDGGVTWQRFASYDQGTHPPELRFGNIAVAADDPDTIVWLPSFNQAPHVTRDRGATWTRINLPGTETMVSVEGNFDGGSHFRHFLDREALAADRLAPGTFYLYHAERGIYRSGDGGETWDQLGSAGLPTGWTVGWFNAKLHMVPDAEGHLLFAPGPLEEGQFPLYESTDGGESWAAVPGVADVEAIATGIGAAPGDPPAIYLVAAIDGERGLYRSLDGLTTYELVASDPGGNYQIVTALAAHPDRFGVVYVGTTGTSFLVGEPTGGG
ncbi:MAG: WD40/YVTN/BNR-like repeat-containing protein [Acidimicrobiales bacterium]